MTYNKVESCLITSRLHVTEADSGTKPVSTAMDLELVKFINSDLTWNAVKKRHRSMMRRPRKPAASNSAIKMQESVAFDYEKVFYIYLLVVHISL